MCHGTSHLGFAGCPALLHDQGAAPIQITREGCVPANKVEAFFKNPFANRDAARTAPLKIGRALIGRVPDARAWLAGGHRLVPVHGFFLSVASKYGYSTMFCLFSAFTVLYELLKRSNSTLKQARKTEALRVK